MGRRPRVLKTTIDPATLMDSVRSESAGGTVVFVGTVRDRNGGKRVKELHYEAYREMAEKKMLEIEKTARAMWPITNIACVHRYGNLKVGDVSVAVAVSSEHRADAFEACRYVIDEIKRVVPLWKKEFTEGGGEGWVEG